MKIATMIVLWMMVIVGQAGADQAFLNPEGAVQALKTADEDTREEAAEYLGSVRFEGAKKALIESLNDVSDDVREEAARALGKLRAKDAVDPLITHLSDDAAGMRAASAEALARIGDRRALEPVHAQYHRENNPINKFRIERAYKDLEKLPAE